MPYEEQEFDRWEYKIVEHPVLGFASSKDAREAGLDAMRAQFNTDGSGGWELVNFCMDTTWRDGDLAIWAVFKRKRGTTKAFVQD